MSETARLLVGLALVPIETLFGLVIIIAWLTVGLRRWVRLLALAALVLALLEVGLSSGLGTLLWYVGGFVVFNLTFGGWRMSQWRVARSTSYAPASATPWPAHAEREVEAWTLELECLGFERMPDLVSTYTMRGDEHRTRARLFRHPTEPVFAWFSATDRAAKTVARALSTPLTRGGWLTTCDHATDSALIPVQGHHSLLRRGTWAEMMAAHRARVNELGGGELVTDPAASAQASRDAWVESILGDGRARVDGELVALNARTILTSQARHWAMWLK